MTAPYYADEHVELWHGDCLKIPTWLDADVLVTDPPYGIAYAAGSMFPDYRPAVRDAITGDGSLEIRDAALRAWGDRPALVFGAWNMPMPSATRQRLVWHKAQAKPGLRTTPWFSADEEIYVLGSGFVGHPGQSVITTRETRDGAHGLAAEVGHPTPKPVGLMESLIRKCPPGVVADPFAGSGSTLLAARNQGRRCVGVEIDERYCEIAAKRLAQGVLDFGEPA